MVWPNFFLMNVSFALKGSKLFIIIFSLLFKSEKDRRGAFEADKGVPEKQLTFFALLSFSRELHCPFYLLI